jgi:hypothetical protein
MVNGLARRGFGQGHWHQVNDGSSDLGFIANAGTGSVSAGIVAGTVLKARAIITDGTNGTPRVARDTNSPAFSMHLYLQLCHYEAA